MADSAPATSALRQIVAGQHPIGMRRVLACPGAKPVSKVHRPLLVYILVLTFLVIPFSTPLSVHIPAATQLYIVCKDLDSQLCVTWLFNLQSDEEMANELSIRDNSNHFCGLSDLNPVSPHRKFIMVKPFYENEKKKPVFCKTLNVITKDAFHLADEAGKLRSIYRERRQTGHSPRGRYRGQTQSQYLAIEGSNGKDEGKAEAHSAADSSRASVRGNSGMGQAQSQTVYDPSCDECYSRSDLDAANLSQRPGQRGGQNGLMGQTPGGNGKPNGAPDKSFISAQNGNQRGPPGGSIVTQTSQPGTYGEPTQGISHGGVPGHSYIPNQYGPGGTYPTDHMRLPGGISGGAPGGTSGRGPGGISGQIPGGMQGGTTPGNGVQGRIPEGGIQGGIPGGVVQGGIPGGGVHRGMPGSSVQGGMPGGGIHGGIPGGGVHGGIPGGGIHGGIPGGDVHGGIPGGGVHGGIPGGGVHGGIPGGGVHGGIPGGGVHGGIPGGGIHGRIPGGDVQGGIQGGIPGDGSQGGSRTITHGEMPGGGSQGRNNGEIPIGGSQVITPGGGIQGGMQGGQPGISSQGGLPGGGGQQGLVPGGNIQGRMPIGGTHGGIPGNIHNGQPGMNVGRYVPGNPIIPGANGKGQTGINWPLISGPVQGSDGSIYYCCVVSPNYGQGGYNLQPNNHVDQPQTHYGTGTGSYGTYGTGNGQQNGNQPYGTITGQQTPYGPGTTGQQTPYGTGITGQQIPYGTGNTGQQSPYGPGTTGQQTTYGIGTTGQQMPYGTSNTGQQIPYGTTSNTGQQLPYGTSNTGQQLPYGTSNTGHHTPYGTDNSGQQTSYGTGNAGQQTPYGTGNTGQQTPYGTGTTGQQIPYGTGTTGQRTPYGTGTTNQQMPYGTGTTGQQTPYGTTNTGQQTPYGMGNTGQQTPYGMGNTGQQTPYGTGPTGQQTYNTGSMTPQTTYGTGGMGQQTPYGMGTGGQQTSYGTGTTGSQIPYSTGDTGQHVPYGTGNTGEQTPYGTGTTGQQTTYNTGTTGQATPYGTGNMGQQGPYGIGNTGQQGPYLTGTKGHQTPYGTDSTGQQGPYSQNGYSYNQGNTADQNQQNTGQGMDINREPQNVMDSNSIITEDDDSQAEAAVSQGVNGTTATASSNGGNSNGRAESNVHGTYTGTGSFSAQAAISDDNKGAESQVSGSKKGATSNAAGRGRKNKSQAAVKFGSETGSIQTESQSSGIMHSSNTQVQGSLKGGVADAQARGPGSTSSQAQIGFTPYKEGDKSHDHIKAPFEGGGTSSAQSSGRMGTSQSQLRGTFKYGITYNGAAQAGASLDKDAVFSNLHPFDKIDVFDENNTNIDVNNAETEKPSEINTLSPPLSPPTAAPFDTDLSTEKTINEETLRTSEDNISDHTHSDHHQKSLESNTTAVTPLVGNRRAFPSAYGNSGDYEYNIDDNPPEEYDIDDVADGNDASQTEQGEYTIYDNYARESDTTHESLHSPNRKGLDVRQTTGGNTQHILIGSLKNQDAKITQIKSERPDESKIYQPGERVPGMGGYTIPVGFTGSVKSVASKDKTYVVGSRDSPSQAQTVTLTPGTGKIKYMYPDRYGKNVHPKDLRSLYNSKTDDNRYVSVSKSVTRDLDSENNIRKQYSHTYYTKSSSCGYFTFTCTMVSSAEGKKKVCKPKIPTNPDGTPMRC
ncbi:uncharacterized protein ACR2FA_002519 [Aphomia sociella]